jgi:tetratricopeptide (TPR) repeat protein
LDFKKKATTLCLKNNFVEASKILDESLEVEPNDTELIIKRANCFKKLQMYPAAVKDLFEVLKINKGNKVLIKETEKKLADTLFEIAYQLQLTKNFIDSKSYYTEALMWFKHPKYFIARGLVF